MHRSRETTGSPLLTPVELAGRVAGLAEGARLAVLGLTRDGVGQVLVEAGIGRGALLVAAGEPRSATAVVDGVLDDLADLALARWPDWPDGSAPEVSGPWLKA
ncbi:hypothetical protein HPY25_31785, partial [Methylobacterium sp. IIF4SW-B5]|nr:hypothetical protein [Methylobacterium ajmalii]